MIITALLSIVRNSGNRRIPQMVGEIGSWFVFGEINVS